MPLLESKEAFLIMPHFASPPQLAKTRKIDAVSFGSSNDVLGYRGRRAVYGLQYKWILDGTDLTDFINFFMARRGSWESWWVPSWRGELVLDAEPVTPISSNGIDVKPCEYGTFYDPTDTDKTALGHYIWLYNLAGQLNIYEVTAVSGTNPHSLTVTLVDGSDTEVYEPANTLMGFMYHVRLSGDSLQFDYVEEAVASVSMNMIEVIGVDGEVIAAPVGPSLDFSLSQNSFYIPL